MNNLIHTKANKCDIDSIIAMLSNIYPVTEELQKEFKTHAVELKLQTDDHILYEGEICKYMYFIKSGAVMGYTNHHQKQIITYITVENEFVSSLSGLYGDQPSVEAIKAVEPSVLLGVHTDILLGWYNKFFDLNFIIRKVYENYYRHAQERSRIIRVGNAKERYLYFSKTRKALVNRLPIPILAGFLDMKPETLIRIKKEIEKDVDGGGRDILLQSLIDNLLVNQSFKDKNLTSKTFAKQNNITLKKLNDCINKGKNLKFRDFINTYRLSYFKKLFFKDKDLKNFTIEALALKAGFSSRSNFYASYKKLDGTFPQKLD